MASDFLAMDAQRLALAQRWKTLKIDGFLESVITKIHCRAAQGFRSMDGSRLTDPAITLEQHTAIIDNLRRRLFTVNLSWWTGKIKSISW